MILICNEAVKNCRRDRRFALPKTNSLENYLFPRYSNLHFFSSSDFARSFEMLPFNIVLLLTATAMTSAAELPDFIHVCKRKDPQVNDCIAKSVEFLRPYLLSGVPELNIPSLEPLYLKELVAAESTGLKITARDIRTYGASDYTIRGFKLDFDTMHCQFSMDLPHLYIDAMYHVDGKVLLLPIAGSGPMRGNFTACTGSVDLKGEVKKDANGEDRLRYTDFHVKFTVGNGYVELENLFGGDRTLGDLVNSAINNNFDVFLRELQPLLEKALSETFQRIANNIVEPFTWQQLFPDD
ncbi:protein takeout [Athalia rosae]|uniref:protein takeout n=1 Tax=Athalia rosae TaxID=37344 RepID=UPI00203419F6|nr:protein takeout [Athalia rosae]